MNRKVELLVVFYGIIGGLQLLGALMFVLVGVLGSLGLLEPKDTLEDRVGGAVAAALLAFFIAALGAAHLVVAWGLKGLRPWARMAGLALGALDTLNCCNCISLALGIYALVTLSRDDVAGLFAKQAS